MKTLLFAMLFISFPLISCTNGPNARSDTSIGAGSPGGLIGRNFSGVAVGEGLGALAGNKISGVSDPATTATTISLISPVITACRSNASHSLMADPDFYVRVFQPS